ncbi:MAG TPA: aminopeptidase P family protein [Desulfonatronum sp.]|nr:aminopeptidase P family protein [Desulfonatronum sp.]
MTFEALERIPRSELELRWERCRSLLRVLAPEAGGLLVFSRLNSYYLSGTWPNGLFWLPLAGEPVLFSRRGLERARLESSCKTILAYRSFRDLSGLAREAGVPLSSTIAAEMSGLSWSLSQGLTRNLDGHAFISGDMVLHRTRCVKTPWELAKLRLAGQRHNTCLRKLLPARISPGMTEQQIAHRVWEVFFSQGHQGLMRMQSFGEEIFLGHVAAGDSANYPSVFDGPLGLRGEHPAITHMGYAGKVWQEDEPLALDVGFVLEGYHTDKTQVYWGESRSTLPEQACRAHDFCIQVQNWLADHLVPGAVPSRLFSHCWQWAEKQGWSEGFMALGGNKVRFLGHGIGLAIDEYPALAKGFDVPLEQGMVLALEPKIGIPGLGMVGVENTFEVTGSGGRCLTGEDYSMVCLGDYSNLS